MNAAAVYFRVSTSKQDRSIDDQRQAVQSYANSHGYTITEWFDRDEGKSGTSFEKRPDFMRMVHLIESSQHGFVTVLVYDVDRWGRSIDPEEATYWRFHLKRLGVQVVFVSDEALNRNDMAARIQLTLKQEVATEESKKQSLRVRERSFLRATEGYRVGGFAHSATAARSSVGTANQGGF